MENNTWLIAVAVIAVIAIVAVFGMVNMTGYAVNGRIIAKDKDICSIYLQQCMVIDKDSCEKCCSLQFICNMEKCRYIAKEFDPVKKTTEMQYCINVMTEDYQNCLNNCGGNDIISPILEA